MRRLYHWSVIAQTDNSSALQTNVATPILSMESAIANFHIVSQCDPRFNQPGLRLLQCNYIGEIWFNETKVST